MLPRIPGLVLALVLTACFNRIDLSLGLPDASGALEETVLLGDDGPKLVLVDVSGLISDEPRVSALGFLRQRSMVAELRQVLDRAREDDDVAGLLLRIHSPGGSVAASETLHHELEGWRAERGLPVVAFLNGIAASGGYYVAMAADEVIAHPASVTGSIGVVLPGLNFSGLMERYGVADQTLTSARYKDAGSPMRPMRAEERAHLESVLADLHARFVAVVDAGRPRLDSVEITALADGRVLSAGQALERGLVDATGFIEDAIAALERRAGLSSSRLVLYHRPGAPAENVHSRAGMDGVGAGPLSHGFYYLWPPAMGAPPGP